MISDKTRRFEAELRVRVYSDGRPSHVEFEEVHKINDFLDDVDNRWHRVMWDKYGKCRTLWLNHDPVSSEWSNSDYLLRLDQLPFGELSSRRVEATLYLIGITRLGYLIRWTEEGLERACGDISIVAGAKKVVEAAGYRRWIELATFCMYIPTNEWCRRLEA